MRFESVAEPIELSDNSGRALLTLLPRGATHEIYFADVEVAYVRWDETGSFNTRLTGLPLARVGFVGLSRSISTWLENSAPFEKELMACRGEYLALSVGPLAGFTHSPSKPVCHVTFRWCGLAGDYPMVVDQSCLRLFREGIDGWLRLRGDPKPSRG